MPNWNAVMEEAKRLEWLLRHAEIDPKKVSNEAEKSLGYYLFKGYDDQAIERYLKEMADNPPPRSHRTQRCYKELYRIWQEWGRQCKLSGIDKARAWGWGIRMACAAKI